jgi:hypothetical protein
MKWMTTCKETTELASRAMDERLSFGDRLALRMHLAICKNCTRFNQQLQDMRRLFRLETTADDDDSGLSTEARQRIANELRNKPDHE